MKILLDGLTFGRILRFLLVSFCLSIAGSASAQNGLIRLNCFPSLTVADARSTVTITAEVRDSAGRTVPDGTQVMFSTTAGTLRQTIGITQNGLARIVLVTSGTPGTAKVTASALSIATTANVEIEFLSDRSLLASAQEYVEVVAPGFLAMSMDSKTLEASAPRPGVALRYREISIVANELQLNAMTMEVKARKAKMTIGKETHEYADLYIALPKRRGLGTTTFKVNEQEIIPNSRYFTLAPVEREKFGLVAIRAKGIEPAGKLDDTNTFAFVDMTASATLISAKKAVVFPRKEVQFHKAELVMNGSTVMKFPLFQVNLNGATPIITDQIFNVNDNRVAINYPHYLSLKPGQTSLLRFHTGDDGGVGFNAIGGAFLDYEVNWNKGDEAQGNFTLGGIGRKDFRLSARQFLRLDEKSSISGQVDSPGVRSLLGTVNYNRDLNNYQFNLTANGSRSLGSQRNDSQQLSMNLDSNPIKLGKSPFNFTYGLQGISQGSNLAGTTYSQTEIGLDTRLQMTPIALAKQTNLNSYAAVGKFVGHNANRALSITAGTSLSTKISSNWDVLFAYDFIDDGFSNQFAGMHRLSLQTGITLKRINANFMGVRSLDIDRSNYQTDLSYQLAKQWRFGYFNTYDRFLGSGFFDSGARLMYTYAARDFGVIYSQRTHRFGLQIMGATFN